jgi:hypothetical protein
MTIEELISKYPKIFENYEGNPGNCNWLDLPTGWISNIDDLCGSIQEYIDTHVIYTAEGKVTPQQVTCVQMKEKFGGLRFYTNGHDDHVEGMISLAEYLCDNTCQQCGSRKDLGLTSHWISVLCRTCVISHGDRAMKAWTPKSK